MRFLIIEDEKRSALRLEKLITNYDKIKNPQIEFAENLQSANQMISNNFYDVVFLDLNLNSKNGFDIFQNISSNNFLTIVVSAHTDQAIKAFEYGVLDFVPKPVFKERLILALKKILDMERVNTRTKNIVIKTSGKIESIAVNDIIYFQPADHYTEMILENGQKKLHNLSLDKIYKILPDYFKRTHRAYIVNENFIKNILSYPGSKYKVELDNSEILPVGRKYIKQLKQNLMS